MMNETSRAVWAVAVALVGGAVLQAADVSVGNGIVVDWRTVRSGETLLDGADAFDAAYLFVTLVGEESALSTLEEPAAPPPEPRVPVRIQAYMAQANGGRLRAFEAGPFRVSVEAHEDDAAQAAFVSRLAAFAAEVSS